MYSGFQKVGFEKLDKNINQELKKEIIENIFFGEVISFNEKRYEEKYIHIFFKKKGIKLKLLDDSLKGKTSRCNMFINYKDIDRWCFNENEINTDICTFVIYFKGVKKISINICEVVDKIEEVLHHNISILTLVHKICDNYDEARNLCLKTR